MYNIRLFLLAGSKLDLLTHTFCGSQIASLYLNHKILVHKLSTSSLSLAMSVRSPPTCVSDFLLDVVSVKRS